MGGVGLGFFAETFPESLAKRSELGVLARRVPRECTNHTLRVASGDLDEFIGKTTINQAGRAVQIFAVIMAVYLSISLTTSFLLNLYNKRIQIVER